MAELIFLGTGGGRFVTIEQTRATGGLYLFDRGSRIHIDPGPGALNRLHKMRINPYKTNAILITHCHPDHYIDAEILVEAMTGGCRCIAGTLAASKSILCGIKNHGPAISKYHQRRVNHLRIVTTGDSFTIGKTLINAIPAVHSDTSGVGFKFNTDWGCIIYGADTAPSKKILKSYQGARILILSITTPLDERIPYHLNTNDAAKIAAGSQPELCIITHFGARMLKSNVLKQAAWVEEESGIKTIAARDGMIIKLRKTIKIE